MQERMAKGREIAEAERRARTEILEARQKMKSGSRFRGIREVVNSVAAAAGHDMVLDKSFLPKANKVILLVSEKVPDLTATVTAALNKDKPAAAEAPATRSAPCRRAGTVRRTHLLSSPDVLRLLRAGSRPSGLWFSFIPEVRM